MPQIRTGARQDQQDLVFNEGYEPSAGGPSIDWAQGCRIRDTTGRTYIDLGLGAGTALLGHAHPMIVQAIQRQVAIGSLYIRPNPVAHEFAALLATAIPHFGGFLFCNSGAEATMRACRLARSFTGKRKIGMFSGGWHGAHDQLLVEEDYAGNSSAPRAVHRSAGIPRELLDLIVLLPYNDDRAFGLIEENADDLAMVLIEPSQGSNPRADVEPFLRGLRQVTRARGVLLGFDEIITGFRLALGGAQELYGIEADIATYGKIIGGGLPIGVVGGTREVMARIRRGGEADGRPVFMGGTFSANPLSMAAGHATLAYLIQRRMDVYGELASAGAKIMNQVNMTCASKGIPVRASGVGSMFRLIFTDKPIRSRRDRDALELGSAIQARFYASVLARGIHVGSNRINFLSTAHGPDEIDLVGATLASALADGQREGWL